MSTIDPDFALLTPTINEAFEKIWTYKDMAEFRGNWVQTRQRFASNIPSDGFDITHEQVPVADNAEIEIRIYRPQGSTRDDLPLMFVLHAGGRTRCSPVVETQDLLSQRLGRRWPRQ